MSATRVIRSTAARSSSSLIRVHSPSTTMSEPGTISAATIGNAAEEGSAGTTTLLGRNSGRPTSSIRRPSPSGMTLTSAPK